VLKLDHAALACFYIGYMFFAIISYLHDFLPLDRELVFPVAVPLGFVFPPLVAIPFALVRPVPDVLLTAFGDGRSPTHRAFTGQARLRFLF
jgi:hypothetical protein